LRYKVDLKKFMADCEANYVRLRRLFPAMDDVDGQVFSVDDRGGRQFAIAVLERSPYTSLIEVAERIREPAPWRCFPVIRVRLYHDARLAEVVGFDRTRRIRPRYPYPNRVMHQPDEKSQWNRFLAEWLSIAIHTGYAVDSPYEFID
jgi:uncharacterized protein YqiB (DUF1249 family)